MIDFSQYSLKNNPFRIGPSIKSDELIWIGMEKLRSDLDNRIEACIRTSPSRIVLNWGRYGSGKTHAANFYTKTNYINTKFNVNTKNIKVNLPRSSKEPVQAFLRALVGQLNFDNIIIDFARFKQEYKDQAESIIDVNTQDSIISQFLKLFFGRPATESSLFPDMAVPVRKDAMKNFLYGDGTKSTLKELNLPLGLDDDEQIVNLISGIFNTISYEKKLYKAIFLWIDEFEDIDTLPKSSQDRFTTFLRQLIDKTPNNLTIFLNFTLKGGGEYEDLSILLGEALASRAKLSIDFEEPTIEEAKSYIIELINHPTFRDKLPEGITDSFFPFTIAAIENVLVNIGRLSIRKINETFSLILELALISETPPESIDLNFINKIKSEIPSWNS